jgi:putative RNA 2'-phosphotransferase
MSKQRSPKQLAKLIDYVLSRRPDEFGLVADDDGFVKIKDLLKAVNEEEGFRYVRRAHLNEIMLTLSDPGFEIADNAIRSNIRDRMPRRGFATDPPKLLYTSVSQKAWPHVVDEGIRPTGFSQVILSSSREMAERIGKRFDRSAVLLTVQVQACLGKDVVFFEAGETLFLAEFIPTDCFSGPPLPKEKPVDKQTVEPQARSPQMPAGSYFIDMNEKSDYRVPKSKHNGADWKKDGKRLKKPKRKRERPPWRR